MAIARIKMGLYVCIHQRNEESHDNRVKRTFNAERADLVKVVGVYVRIHAKQSSHNSAYSVLECPGERHTCGFHQRRCGERKKRKTRRSTDGIREDGLIVEETLGPVHKGVNIFGSWKLRGAFVAHAVFPEVFVSGSIKEGLNEHHGDDGSLSHRGPADIIGH